MFDSVRTKLTIWYTGVLAFVLVLFAVFTFIFLSETIKEKVDGTLSELAAAFESTTANEGKDGDRNDDENDDKNSELSNNAARLTEALQEETDELRFRNYQVFVFDERQNIIVQTRTFASSDEAILDAIKAENLFPVLMKDWNKFDSKQHFVTLAYENEQNGERRFLIQRLSDATPEYTLVIVHSLAEENELRSRLLLIFTFGVLFSLIAAGASGYFLARKSLSPVAAMSRQAAKINVENLSTRLVVRNERDELGALATTFNALLSRLDDAFAQQRRFMADASHELRTPLAIVRGESEVALSKPEREATDYRESLEIVFDESKRMSRIVEDLFTLAKVDAGQFPFINGDLWLDDLLRDCLRSVRTLTEPQNIRIVCQIQCEMPFRGDGELLQRLFLNLFDNAIKYNSPNGFVKLVANKESDFYSIKIIDNGKGVPFDVQAHIFERFFRADNARTRAETNVGSGAGLGLSIARWIAEAHEGTLELVVSDAKGSTFEVKFPIVPRNQTF